MDKKGGGAVVGSRVNKNASVEIIFNLHMLAAELGQPATGSSCGPRGILDANDLGELRPNQV